MSCSSSSSESSSIGFDFNSGSEKETKSYNKKKNSSKYSSSYSDLFSSDEEIKNKEPIKLSKRELVKQLKHLGYEDIPDSIITEFIDDLKKQNITVVDSYVPNVPNSARSSFSSSEGEQFLQYFSSDSDGVNVVKKKANNSANRIIDIGSSSDSNAEQEEFKSRRRTSKIGSSKSKSSKHSSKIIEDSSTSEEELDYIYNDLRSSRSSINSARGKRPSSASSNRSSISSHQQQPEKTTNRYTSPTLKRANSARIKLEKEKKQKKKQEIRKKSVIEKQEHLKPSKIEQTKEVVKESTSSERKELLNNLYVSKFRKLPYSYRKIGDPSTRMKKFEDCWKKDTFLRNYSNQQRSHRWETKMKLIAIEGDLLSSWSLKTNRNSKQ
ncbi:hypothetical protein ABK040_007269 [Willaertia magna]